MAVGAGIVRPPELRGSRRLPRFVGDAAPYSLYKLLIHDRALDPVGGVGTGQDAGKRQRKRDGGTEGLAGAFFVKE